MTQIRGSGYTGLYTSSYIEENTSSMKPCIYAVATEFSSALILIPLVPTFANRVIELVKNSNAMDIYIVAQDIGILAISEYYKAWYEITYGIEKNVHIVSAYPPENLVAPEAFKSCIIRNESNMFSISMPLSDLNDSSVEINFTRFHSQVTSPYACDIILNDNYNSKVFVTEMNIDKADYYKNNIEIDKVHMAFISGSYGGLSYNALLQRYPAIVSKLVCNQFNTTEELNYAIERGITVGEAFSL